MAGDANGCLFFGMGLLRFLCSPVKNFTKTSAEKNPRLKPGAGSIIFCPG